MREVLERTTDGAQSTKAPISNNTTLNESCIRKEEEETDESDGDRRNSGDLMIVVLDSCRDLGGEVVGGL